MSFAFIVIATHNTGHGEASNPMLITEDVTKAVYGARHAESYGYEFLGTEVGIIVYRLALEAPYLKNNFKWQLGDNPPQTLVFYRSHVQRHDGNPHPANGECWKEEWFDTRLQEKVDGVEEAPSGFVSLKDRQKVQTVVGILNDAAAGVQVPDAQLEEAQDFLVGFLEEVNSKRPHDVPPCVL